MKALLPILLVLYAVVATGLLILTRVRARDAEQTLQHCDAALNAHGRRAR
jgi:hypothetical protein